MKMVDYSEFLKEYLLGLEVSNYSNFDINFLFHSSFSVAEKCIYSFPMRQNIGFNYPDYQQLFSKFEVILKQKSENVQKPNPLIYDFSCFLTFLFQEKIITLLELIIIMKSYPVMIGLILNTIAPLLTEQDYMYLYHQFDDEILFNYLVEIYDLEFNNSRIPFTSDLIYLKRKYLSEKPYLTNLS